ncbi:unnamed protein product, partial [Musa acuminata var. zebrina]
MKPIFFSSESQNYNPPAQNSIFFLLPPKPQQKHLATESRSSSDEPRQEWTGGRQSQSQSIPFYRSLALVGFAFASISPRALNSIDR